MSNIKYVWDITDGPYEDDKVEGLLYILAKAELEDGSIEEMEVYTGNFEQTYRFVRHTKSNLGPWTAEDIARIVLGI